MQNPATNRWTKAAVIATDLGDLDRRVPFAMQQAARTGARSIPLHVIDAEEALTADLTGMPYYDRGTVEETG